MAADIPKSAIAVLESPRGFEFEDRPNRPGVAYGGMIALLGGLARPGEEAIAALIREFGEELTADPSAMDVEPLWKPAVRLVPLNGGRLRRVEVHTFLCRTEDGEVRAKEEGHTVIPFAREVFIEGAMPSRMTDFAYGITRSVVLGRTKRLWR